MLYYIQYASYDSWPCSDWPLATTDNCPQCHAYSPIPSQFLENFDRFVLIDFGLCHFHSYSATSVDIL